jgi:glutamyl-tRNA reductase
MQKEGKSSTEILTKIKEAAKNVNDTELNKFVNSLSKSDLKGEALEDTLVSLMAHLDGAFDLTRGVIRDLGLTEE